LRNAAKDIFCIKLALSVNLKNNRCTITIFNYIFQRVDLEIMEACNSQT